MSPRSTKLVEDLVPIIVDSTTWTNTQLFDLSRVSPAWVNPTRRLLYRFPTLTSEIQCRYLVATLESSGACLQLVQGMNLWLDEPPTWARGIKAVRFLLNIRGLKMLSFVDSTATFLIHQMAPDHTITNFYVLRNEPSYMSGRINPIFEWNAMEATMFMSLKRLVLNEAMMHITSPPEEAILLPELVELVISRCTILHGTLSDMLTRTSWSRLRNFTFTTTTYTMQLSPFISLLQDTLETLHLELWPPTPQLPLFTSSIIFNDVFGQMVVFSALRELYLVDVGPLDGALIHTNAMRKLGRCCPILETLTLVGGIPETLLAMWGWPFDAPTSKEIFPHMKVMCGPAHIWFDDSLQSSVERWNWAQKENRYTQHIKWMVVTEVDVKWSENRHTHTLIMKLVQLSEEFLSLVEILHLPDNIA
ncbi:hypothetical protein BU17DRAFT_97045 [Hysterangium stoloniferum]|nr:hypothetical protein BU17DRAFT_97045 [Hysterangium stoloniferum]